MKKTTVKASSDVALVKYWGKKDDVLRLPENGSISMILDGLDTVTTVEFDESLANDVVEIQGEQEVEEVKRVVKQLNLIRKVSGISAFAKVVSQNTFPKGTGLSSSGSGFAALTLAATLAAGVELTQKELSILARQGSGTACRCVCGGFVEWKDADTSEESYSQTLFPSNYWQLEDVIAVVDEGKKNVSSTEGHASARSSIFYETRQKNIAQKIADVKKALKEKNFSTLGQLVEAEALEFHSILLTSNPPLIAWYPGTIEVMLEVQRMRKDGIEAYFTINTGFNVHILTLPEYKEAVMKRVQNLESVKKVLTAKVGDAPKETTEHLF